jgi:hypothetical protein
MLEGNMHWLIIPRFLQKERGFLLRIGGRSGFYADPHKNTMIKAT